MNKVQGETLYQWQKDFFDLYFKHPKNSIFVIKSGRQRAKTHTLQNLIMNESINKKNYHIIVICPTYNLCRKFFKDLTDLLLPIPKLVKNANSSFLEIELYNKSVITLRSAESGNALRGLNCHLLIFDEGAFISMETALQCLNFVNVHQGNVVIASTPTIKDEENNLFAKYWFMAQRGEKNVYSIDFCSYDTSALLSPERKEMYRKQLPYNIFQNEIEGNFLEMSNNLWNIQPILRNNVPKTDWFVGGIDWATNEKQDETSFTIFNSDKQMYQLYHFNDKSPTETVDFIVNILKQLPIKKLVIEKNSIGTIFLDLLKKKISQNNIRTNIIPFVTTNESKRKIIENMQLEIMNQTISLLNDNELILQFSSYEMQTTKSGLITYNGANGYHDDLVVSTGLALSAFSSGSYNIR